MTDEKWRAKAPLAIQKAGRTICPHHEVESLVRRCNAELDRKDTRIRELEEEANHLNRRLHDAGVGEAALRERILGLERDNQFLRSHRPVIRRIAELEERVRELTEWRPMSEALLGYQAILVKETSGLVNVWMLSDECPQELISEGLCWLPLPEAKL